MRNVLGVLNKVVLAAAERHELGDAGAGIRRPEIGVHEVKLRPADVGRIVEALKSTIPNSEDQTHEDGDTYTVSFIVAPGRVSDHL
ncbi:MAG TPA: hypothetical protein VF168_00475 [Trueperaceae bacterium]